jgi:hypothetical protein
VKKHSASESAALGFFFFFFESKIYNVGLARSPQAAHTSNT